MIKSSQWSSVFASRQGTESLRETFYWNHFYRPKGPGGGVSFQMHPCPHSASDHCLFCIRSQPWLKCCRFYQVGTLVTLSNLCWTGMKQTNSWSLEGSLKTCLEVMIRSEQPYMDGQTSWPVVHAGAGNIRSRKKGWETREFLWHWFQSKGNLIPIREPCQWLGTCTLGRCVGFMVQTQIDFGNQACVWGLQQQVRWPHRSNHVGLWHNCKLQPLREKAYHLRQNKHCGITSKLFLLLPPWRNQPSQVMNHSKLLSFCTSLASVFVSLRPDQCWACIAHWGQWRKYKQPATGTRGPSKWDLQKYSRANGPKTDSGGGARTPPSHVFAGHASWLSNSTWPHTPLARSPSFELCQQQ